MRATFTRANVSLNVRSHHTWVSACTTTNQRKPRPSGHRSCANDDAVPLAQNGFTIVGAKSLMAVWKK